MRMLSPASLFLAATAVALAGCGEEATLPVAAGTGPNPQLPRSEQNPDPHRQHRSGQGLARRRHAASSARPQVAAFADGLDHPRWLYVLPNGDVLVAETNAPPKDPRKAAASRAGFMDLLMSRAGAKTPSANRITLLRDTDGDGMAETRSVFLEGPELAVRHGTGRQGPLRRQHRRDRCASPTRRARRRSRRPAPRSWTCPAARSTTTGPRTSSPARTGGKLYVTVGSNSNVGENGMEKEEGRAAIWEVDLRQRPAPHLRLRPAQPQRHGLGADDRQAVDGGQRA